MSDDSRLRFTDRQGQYLAFIHAYTLVNGRPPGRADIQHFFRITPPSVHQMLLSLERDGLIGRQKGVARSIQVLVNPADLPRLQPEGTRPKLRFSKRATSVQMEMKSCPATRTQSRGQGLWQARPVQGRDRCSGDRRHQIRYARECPGRMLARATLPDDHYDPIAGFPEPDPDTALGRAPRGGAAGRFRASALER
jgi:hypothetical protein